MTESTEDELGRLVQKAEESLHAAIRAVWYAGIARGVQKERERITSLIECTNKPRPSPAAASINPATPGVATQAAPPPPVHPPVPSPTAPAPAAPTSEYGAISRPVREALQRLPLGPNGASINDVAGYISSRGAPISLEQVRTALKVMAKRGEIRRTTRGRYAMPKKEAPPQGGASSITDEATTSSNESPMSQRGTPD